MKSFSFLINLKAWQEIPKKWPLKNQWVNFFRVLSKKEKIYLVGFLVILIGSIIGIRQFNWIQESRIIPAEGGGYKEAVVGSPRFINPLLSPTNDVDRDLCQLVYSGLMKYDSKGNLVPDLAEEYKIGEYGKIYEFFLRKNVKWHDDYDFNAEDVVYTIQTLQNPEYSSPLRINWQGVKVEKIDDFRIRFTLTNPYAPFLENTTLGILPKHIWHDIPPQDFPLTKFNLTPVGTGPYQFKKFEKDEMGSIQSLELIANKNYYDKKPYLSKIIFYFEENETEAITDLISGKVNGISLVSSSNLSNLDSQNLNIYSLTLPRYFGVFFNQTKSKPLSDKAVRKALNLGTDKKQIVDEVLQGEGLPVHSPILPGQLGFDQGFWKDNFKIEAAKNILEEGGWGIKGETEFREKVSEEGEVLPLEITLVTVSQPELEKTVDLLKEQWRKIGVKVNSEILSISEIQQQYIRPREYQALLIGEAPGIDPDPFSFWHSSQKRYPGLNLSLYDDKSVDKLLEEGRQNLDPKIREEKYKEFQKILLEDYPAVFLYSPYYLYLVQTKIKGIEAETICDPSQRFIGIENWYIKTKRVKK